MKKEEHALITIAPQHGWGAKGLPLQTDLGVPTDATVLMEVTLLSVEKAKDMRFHPVQEKTDRCAVVRAMGNAWFKLKDLDRAMRRCVGPSCCVLAACSSSCLCRACAVLVWCSSGVRAIPAEGLSETEPISEPISEPMSEPISRGTD